MLDNNDAKVGTGGSSMEHLRIDIPDESATNNAYSGVHREEEVENLESDFNGRGRGSDDQIRRPLINTASNLSSS